MIPKFLLFLFGFACDRSDQVRRYDGRVRHTIGYIIEEFFKAQPDDAMLYMCMDSDGRGRNRHITFSLGHKTLKFFGIQAARLNGRPVIISIKM